MGRITWSVTNCSMALLKRLKTRWTRSTFSVTYRSADPVGDGLGVQERRPLGDVQVGRGQELVALEAQRADALAARSRSGRVSMPCAWYVVHAVESPADDVRVEGAAQPAVGREGHHGDPLDLLVLLEQRI